MESALVTRVIFGQGKYETEGGMLAVGLCRKDRGMSCITYGALCMRDFLSTVCNPSMKVNM